MEVNRHLGTAHTTTIAMVVLAGGATLAGLLVPGLYAEDVLAAAMRGQDLATLIALPLLILALRQTRRGSPRATVVWIGLLGYLLYTYAGAAFAYHFNRLFPIHVALFSLSIVALLALEHRTRPTDAAARRRFARYWRAIRPGGAFVTRQLLKAVARRAERASGATGSATQLSN